MILLYAELCSDFQYRVNINNLPSNRWKVLRSDQEKKIGILNLLNTYQFNNCIKDVIKVDNDKMKLKWTTIIVHNTKRVKH